jgi:hypothetical protein
VRTRTGRAPDSQALHAAHVEVPIEGSRDQDHVDVRCQYLEGCPVVCRGLAPQLGSAGEHDVDRRRPLLGPRIDCDPVTDDRQLRRPGLMAQAPRGPGLEGPVWAAERHLPGSAMRADDTRGDEPLGHWRERGLPARIPAEAGEARARIDHRADSAGASNGFRKSVSRVRSTNPMER